MSNPSDSPREISDADLLKGCGIYHYIQHGDEAYVARSIREFLKAHSLQERIDELKETVIAQGTFPEDRSYGHGSFHHVPAEEVEARIKQLEGKKEAL